MPSDFTEPKRAMPTTSKSRALPAAVIFTVEPTAYVSFEAVVASMTTSPGPVAQRPSSRRNGVVSAAPFARLS